MPINLNPDIAALPLYQLGFHNGQDVGLMVALNAIVAEMTREAKAATRLTKTARETLSVPQVGMPAKR